jgi:hypothetical protein
MNIAHFDIKRTEEFSHFRGSHRRYTLTLKARNMNKEQAKALYVAVESACVTILPKKEDTEYGQMVANLAEKIKSADEKRSKGGRPKGSKNKPKDVK